MAASEKQPLTNFKWADKDSEEHILWKRLWGTALLGGGQLESGQELQTVLELNSWSPDNIPQAQQDQLLRAFPLELGSLPELYSINLRRAPESGPQFQPSHPELRVFDLSRAARTSKTDHFLIREEYRILLNTLDRLVATRKRELQSDDPRDSQAASPFGHRPTWYRYELLWHCKKDDMGRCPGETWSLYYLLFTYLCRRQPVFFQRESQVSYFNADGVQSVPPACFEWQSDVVKALGRSYFFLATDSQKLVLGAAPLQAEAHLLVLALSPNRDRIKVFRSHTKLSTWYMDLWSHDEIMVETYVGPSITIVALSRQ